MLISLIWEEITSFPESEKAEANKVKGCMSQVWLIPQNRGEGRIGFIADSDSHLVRGLIAILTIIYDGKTKTRSATFDIENYFAFLGLSEHLSPNRRNGFFAMVQRIKALA